MLRYILGGRALIGSAKDDLKKAAKKLLSGVDQCRAEIASNDKTAERIEQENMELKRAVTEASTLVNDIQRFVPQEVS